MVRRRRLPISIAFRLAAVKCKRAQCVKMARIFLELSGSAIGSVARFPQFLPQCSAKLFSIVGFSVLPLSPTLSSSLPPRSNSSPLSSPFSTPSSYTRQTDRT
ncbi:unnamed protein product [Amoebophrya sp. A25]|nr:unnamed protein product [Amoebophrya sp. A25]|eukprot:GSA25T00018064001.1